MKATVKAAIITGLFGLATTALATFWGLNTGTEQENDKIMDELNRLIGNGTGSTTNITINDIGTFVKDYESIKHERTGTMNELAL